MVQAISHAKQYFYCGHHRYDVAKVYDSFPDALQPNGTLSAKFIKDFVNGFLGGSDLDTAGIIEFGKHRALYSDDIDLSVPVIVVPIFHEVKQYRTNLNGKTRAKRTAAHQKKYAIDSYMPIDGMHRIFKHYHQSPGQSLSCHVMTIQETVAVMECA